MIKYVTGDILKADTEALINTVNCVGVMGRGIALQFKNAYPDNYKEYKRVCDIGEMIPGKMFIHHTGMLTNPKYIINFPTKRHWKGKSRIEDIESGLDALAIDIKELGISSIAVPPLGSGLGGLSWRSVRALIEQKMNGIDNLTVIVYEPTDVIAKTRSRNAPNMTSSRAVAIKLIDRYLQGLMDPFVSLLEVQKLMYFMQVVGEPLRLNYQKDHYGPYAPNLRYILNSLEGHYISGYGDGGDNPRKPLQLVPGAIKDADEYLSDNKKSNTLDNLDKVSELVSGFETSFGLELLATVHWVVESNNTIDDSDLVHEVHNWNARKQRFTLHQIRQARSWLSDNGVIAAS